MPCNKIREQTVEEVQDAQMRAVMSEGYEAAVEAKAGALAPSPPGHRNFADARAMQPPLIVPPSTKPPPPEPQAAAKRPPPTLPGTLAPSPPGARMTGGAPQGPDFGGTLIPESTAGSVFTSYRGPVGPMGRSIRMLPAEASDRALKSFPRGAFDLLPESDPPILGVIGGVRGPGWFRKLHDEA